MTQAITTLEAPRSTQAVHASCQTLGENPVPPLPDRLRAVGKGRIGREDAGRGVLLWLDDVEAIDRAQKLGGGEGAHATDDAQDRTAPKAGPG